MRLSTNSQCPTYAYPNDAGADVFADETVFLQPNEIAKIKTGVWLNIPDGWEVQVRSRSGNASKGVVVANSPGTIDAGYDGEISVLLINHSKQIYCVPKGTAIAQLIVSRVSTEPITFNGVVHITNQNQKRGTNGFGSTGVVDSVQEPPKPVEH